MKSRNSNDILDFKKKNLYGVSPVVTCRNLWEFSLEALLRLCLEYIP